MIDRDDWARLDLILDAALEKPEAERSAFLDEACKGAPEMRARAAELLRLAADDDERLRAGGGLQGPLWEEVAERFEDDGPGGARAGDRPSAATWSASSSAPAEWAASTGPSIPPWNGKWRSRPWPTTSATTREACAASSGKRSSWPR